MSTVGAIVDRVFRDYLSNPSDTPLQVGLSGNVLAGATTVVYNAGELIPEEVDLISPGIPIEIDIEMMRVTAHDESTRTLTVTRALYGTADVQHDTPNLIRIAPRFPRKVVFDTVADEIVALYPELYHEGSEWADPDELVLEIPASENAVGVLSILQYLGGDYVELEGRLVRTDEFGSGVAIQFTPRHGTNEIWVRYSRSFSRPTAETDTLTSLGVDPSWDRIILYGVLSSLMASADVDAVTQEFVTEQLEQQGFPATTGISLAVRLAQLKELELGKARNRLRARNTPRANYVREL